MFNSVARGGLTSSIDVVDEITVPEVKSEYLMRFTGSKHEVALFGPKNHSHNALRLT